MRAHARVYAHAYKFYHGSSNTKTFGFASLVFELCSIFSFLLFFLLGVRALHRCFIKIPCFLVLCLNLNTYTDYRKKRGQKALRVRAKLLLWVFFCLFVFRALVFELTWKDVQASAYCAYVQCAYSTHAQSEFCVYYAQASAYALETLKRKCCKRNSGKTSRNIRKYIKKTFPILLGRKGSSVDLGKAQVSGKNEVLSQRGALYMEENIGYTSKRVIISRVMRLYVYMIQTVFCLYKIGAIQTSKINMSYRQHIDKFLFCLHKHVYIIQTCLYENVYIHHIDSVYEI